MKVVLDANVLISGLAYPNSIPGRIVSAWDLLALRPSMSRFQLDKASRVLRGTSRRRKSARNTESSVQTRNHNHRSYVASMPLLAPDWVELHPYSGNHS
jgi:predicted nucleic acid-binding protein